ncbi:MAG: hypothetical protein HYV95_13010 [Opitutae bacterium]|nr:hypothetical protein [Opitutae bacterium]
MDAATRISAPFSAALRAVWLRAARFSLPVGLLQVAINQGDHWLHGQVTPVVLAKSLLTPLVTYSVALCTAIATYRQFQSPP